MALKHAIFVSLAEKAASGYDLARRFDKSLGFFWQASHQQIYQLLTKMERSGEVSAQLQAGDGKPGRKVYQLTEAGRRALHEWTAEPTATEQPRSEFAVKIRGMNFGNRTAIRQDIKRQRDAHRERLSYYLADAARNYPEPQELQADQLPSYLVLRGGIRTEEGYIAWCEEMLELLDRSSSSQSPIPTAKSPKATPAKPTMQENQ